MPQATQPRPAESPGPDTVTLDIIRGKLLAAADEMGVVLARASMAPVIYEVLDFACGITDAEAQLLSQTNGITVFTGTFQERIVAIKRKFGATIAPGDVFAFNDPFDGGSHLPDVSIIKPPRGRCWALPSPLPTGPNWAAPCPGLSFRALKTRP